MFINFENAFNNTSNSTTNFQLNQFSINEIRFAFDQKVIIIDLYEISNFDKTFFLNQLKKKLEQTYFAFYENFEMIVIFVFDDLEIFQNMKKQKKNALTSTCYRHNRKKLRWQRIRCNCRWTFHVLIKKAKNWMIDVYSKWFENIYAHFLFKHFRKNCRSMSYKRQKKIVFSHRQIICTNDNKKKKFNYAIFVVVIAFCFRLYFPIRICWTKFRYF